MRTDFLKDKQVIFYINTVYNKQLSMEEAALIFA